ncbi:MAG: hypothetical protein JXQ96_01935 [Cyclobacteriaceae bacterium]
MKFEKLEDNMFKVAYFDRNGSILFEETMTQTEVEVWSKFTNMSDEKFLEALAQHPKEKQKGV